MDNQDTVLSDIYVKVRGLTFSRGSRKIFDEIDLDIPRGKVTAIMGPSGTGKTTLLKLIGSQLKPHAGQVEIEGRNIHQLERSELFEARKNLGMLFQSGALLTDLNVYENVAFPLRRHTELSDDLIRHLVLMRLHAVGLRNARDLMPSELSGGMARRVALARALIFDPAMIMYDEPFTGQDPISMDVLVKLIRSLNQALGLTSLVVSHDVAETLSIADYVYLIADGRVVAKGTPQQLEDSDSPWIKQFFYREGEGIVPFHFPGEAYAKDLLGGSKRRGE